MIKLLKQLVETLAQMREAKAEIDAQICELRRKHDALIQSATDDEKALAQIAVLKGQESYLASRSEQLNRRIQKAEKEADFEAKCASQKVARELEKRREKLFDALVDALAPFYPEERARRNIVRGLKPMPEEIFEIGRETAGLEANCGQASRTSPRLF
jgi:hypothetical protein